MMGQFVVTDPTNINALYNATDILEVYPNPTKDRIFVQFKDPDNSAYYISIINTLGRTVLMLPQPQLQQGIDISNLSKGVYYLLITDQLKKKTITKSIVIE